MTPPIFWITGPPAAGKTTLCAALLAHFPRAMQIPVDDVRGWVVQGMADSVPWTEETERQFQIAEAAVCDVARRYHDAGFAVAFDHCRNPQRLNALLNEHFPDIPVRRVCLMPNLEVNLHRSRTRTNKSFDPHLLDDTIRWTNEHYREGIPAGWLVVDNSNLTVPETVKLVLEANPTGR